MIPVKIQCGCGQRYAFDVEPVHGRMPGAVACPVCGADGTSAADSAIAQSLAAATAVATAPVGTARLRPALTAPAMSLASTASPAIHPAPTRGGGRLPGQVDRTQAEVEARAKISWGDAPVSVISYLRMQGFSQEEASGLVATMFRERAATIRSNGIRKSFVGVGLMFVPVVALVAFLSMGYFPLKLFAVTLMIGTYGAWQLLKGVIMILAPKSEPGDVAEQ